MERGLTRKKSLKKHGMIIRKYQQKEVNHTEGVWLLVK